MTKLRNILNKLFGEIFFATNMLIWKFEYEKIGFLFRKNLTIFLNNNSSKSYVKKKFYKITFSNSCLNPIKGTQILLRSISTALNNPESLEAECPGEIKLTDQ